MERFVVCYSRLDGEMIQSRSQGFASIAEAAVQFNKWVIDPSPGFSIMMVDTKTNTVLQHYVHNRYPRRDVFIHENEELHEETREEAEEREKTSEEPPVSPDDYNNY